jgi:hypothetical protein
MAAACDAMEITAKVINLFIRLAFLIVELPLWILGIWHLAGDTVDKWHQIPYPKRKCINSG